MVVKGQICYSVIVEYFGFIGFGQYKEFVCVIFVNWFIVSLYWDGLKVYMFIGVQVVYQMVVIGVQCVFFGEVKVIVVFYIEFMILYYVEMWVVFVVEFLLDLIYGQWQVFVVVYMIVEDIGDQFFGGWCKQYIVIMMVFQVQYFFVIGVIMFVFLLQIC